LINFAGGLRLSNCVNWRDTLVRTFGAFGTAVKYPSLWFYGENDSYFDPELAKRMHERYTQAGGKAALVAFGVFKRDSHTLFGDRDGLRI